MSILEVVGEHVALTQVSEDKWIGECPFGDHAIFAAIHPTRAIFAFQVSARLDTYHCFSCGEHGGSTDFAARVEQVGGRRPKAGLLKAWTARNLTVDSVRGLKLDELWTLRDKRRIEAERNTSLADDYGQLATYMADRGVGQVNDLDADLVARVLAGDVT